MKVVFIGGGASTLVAANILVKRKDVEIIIINKSLKLGHKLSMTGNGKCNFSPIKDDINAYNHPEFIQELFNKIPLYKYLETLEDLGLPTRTIRNQGYYPVSENASNVVEILINNIKDKVTIINDEIVDYSQSELSLKSGKKISFDKLIFATGGKSYPNTGSDGSVFPILSKHGYQIIDPKAALCPIKVQENVKSLFGARSHAIMSLIKDDNLLYQEEGEIIFKKDALSGIAIMNMSSFIARKQGKYQIKIDFMIADKPHSLNRSSLDLLLGYVSKPIAEFILKKYNINPESSAKEHINELIDGLTGLTFTYKSLYDFDSAQVTCGGVSIKNINPNFKSKIEDNVYFIGEMLDIDGLCGGYNLRYALTSAIKIAEDL